MVPVLFHLATRTMIRPVRQRHLLPVATGGTSLARIGRIDLPELSTSVFSFVREEGEELRPRHITDASVQTSVSVHFVDGNILNEDLSVLIDNPPGFPMGKVGSLGGDPFMDLRHHLFGLRSFRRSFFLKFPFPLSLSQPLCGSVQKLRVFDDRSIGKSGEGLDPHIDPDRERIGWKNRFRNPLAGKRHPPFPGGRPENGTGLDRSFDQTMENDGNGSDLGQAKTVARKITPAVPLRKGQGRVLTLSLEAWVAGILPVFDTAKERLKSQVDPYRHVLERLGIDRFQRRTDLFQGRKRILLSVMRQGNAIPVPRVPSMF